VEGVEMKGMGSGWSWQTCQLHIIVILLHFDSVLVLFIVTKISLYIAILFYALVYDDDDDDDAGLSSGAGTNLKVGRTCQARSAGNKFLSCPSTFLDLQLSTISRFGKRFRVVSTV